MTVYESPAKVNLALIVGPPRPDGYHPIESLTQTVEWLDLLEVVESDQDDLAIEGAPLDPEDNLVVRAVQIARTRADIPPLALRLEKRIPQGAGLGGGSSNAAATLLALTDIVGLPRAIADEIAPGLGSDVPLFFSGGTAMVSSRGETVDPIPSLGGFTLALAVPPFELSTPEVYRRWDRLEGPVGDEISPRLLPPALRNGIPIRNDLTPAAIDLVPDLADFMADLRARWESAVLMTGSGSACFGFFASLDEATDAAASVSDMCRATRGVDLRPVGVSRAV